MVSTTTQRSSVRAVTLGRAARFWLKLGLLSFGGPAGQIALMHQELVERHGWIEERRFLHALNFCMLLPGPEAQQLATYLGWLLHRTRGGLIAGALFILPSLLLLILLSWVYLRFGETPLVAALFWGVKPAVTAIVVHAAWRIGRRVLKSAWAWGLALLAFLALTVLQLPFPLIILGAALLGLLAGHLAPGSFAVPAADERGLSSPTVSGGRRRLPRLLATGVALWAIPMGLLIGWFGWQGTLTQMSWFFTKAALLTFGGAYAVLPYVYQGAVEHYSWLSASQMIDGLALGETTPGPLVMVVVFVAFVGAYLQQVLGPEQAFAAGVTAACLVTWFTFLPSFLFILIGAPWVEASGRQPRLGAPLAAITAAVVGVILNLALFFAGHVFWPDGFERGLDWPAVGLAITALGVLASGRLGVIPVLLGCALLGVGVRMLT